MADCAQCGTTILWGAKKQGDFRFCSDKCLQKGYLGPRLAAVPEAVLDEQVRNVHQGPCSRCGGAGPVDVHMSHRIWSAIHITSHSSQPSVSCRDCGRKSQIKAALFSFLLGWWGFPWGLIMTPVQIYRNIKGILSPPDPQAPSTLLRQSVRLMLAKRIPVDGIANSSTTAPATSLPLPQTVGSRVVKPTKASTGSPFSDIGSPLR